MPFCYYNDVYQFNNQITIVIPAKAGIPFKHLVHSHLLKQFKLYRSDARLASGMTCEAVVFILTLSFFNAQLFLSVIIFRVLVKV